MTDFDTQQLLNQNRRIERLTTRQAIRLANLLEHLAGDIRVADDSDIGSSGFGVLARLKDIADETEERLDYIDGVVDALYELFPGADDELEGDEYPAADSDDEEPEERDEPVGKARRKAPKARRNATRVAARSRN